MNNFLIIITSILGWLVAKDFLLPQVEKLFNIIKQKKKGDVELKTDLSNLKENENNVYENQIEFLMQQVKNLESQLLDYQKQLDAFRQKILELNSHLYAKSLTITKLKNYCCSNLDCKYRCYCEDKNFNETVEKN